MQKPAATLETGGPRDHQAQAAPDQPRKPGGGAMKFVYSSGSRPLEGYTIKRGIGIGGFGEVYFALSDGGKEVALKRIQRNLEVEVRGVTQCLNLKHTNLVDLYDVKYDDQGEAWVVMEYISGQTLKEVLDQHPQGLPPQDVRNWFAGIAAGVSYLHEHGIVHRDLKPGNIFLDEDVVKIGDYGLSKFISCSRRSGQTESVGTFHYMAPEIGKGVYGKEIDIYALGVILFEMLTGRVPFEGESSQEIIMKHLTADPNLSGLDSPYRQVIQRALRKDPAHRFSHVRQMVAALNETGAERPPIVMPAEAVTESSVLYITDEDIADAEIVFGPLRQTKPEVAPTPSRLAAPAAVPVADEPIAKAVREMWRSSLTWWKQANLSTPVKIVLLVVGLALLILNAQWMLPVAVVLAIPYAMYLVIRGLVLSTDSGGATAPAGASPPPARVVSAGPVAHQRAPFAEAGAPQPVRTVNAGKSRRVALRTALRSKGAGQRSAELLGSLLTSAIVVAVLGVVMLVASGQPLDSSVQTWSLYGWLTLVSTLMTWSLLAVGKLWEGSDGDQLWRRFTMLVVGLGLGAGALAAQHLLLINLNHVHNWGAFSVGDLPPAMHAQGAPLLPAYLAWFAGLLAVLRWWKQTDPLRGTRLSLTATAICLLVAWLLPFPQPLGIMLAATTSVAVQMASPWLSSAQQKELSRPSSAQTGNLVA